MVSRFTFRERTDVCWQKRVRDSYLHEGTPDVDLSLKTAIVRPVSRRLAEMVIKKYEWLGTMATGVNRFYGIFFGPYCAGVTTFAPSGFGLPSLAKSFGVDGNRLAYLGRGANVHWSPPGANSKLIGHSLRFEQRLGNKIAVAFADTDAGEIGTVYQATNWIYIGTGSVWPQFVSQHGRLMSFNQFTKWAKDQRMKTPAARAFLLANGWREQKTNPKGRYVFILDRSDAALIARIERMRQPYPKRCGGSVAVGTSVVQIEGGGSNPTPPPHHPDPGQIGPEIANGGHSRPKSRAGRGI